MLRCLTVAASLLLASWSVGLADEVQSCLSGKNPRFNLAGTASSNSAVTDVGIADTIEKAGTMYKEKAAQAVFDQIGNTKPAPNPAFKDQFGQPVDPIKLLPQYASGLQQVLSVLASDKAITQVLSLAYNDAGRRRILGIIGSRYQLADDYTTEYRMRAARGPVSAQDREQYIEQMGRLLNANDLYLKQWFGMDTINPNTKDGTVRARGRLDVVDQELKDERIRKAAVDLYAQMQAGDSYYKDLSLPELECRLKATSQDLDTAEKIAKARAQATSDSKLREAAIQRTKEYDATHPIGSTSPRPYTTDDMVGLPGSGSAPASPIGSGRGIGSVGNSGPRDIGGVSGIVRGNGSDGVVKQYLEIAPTYSPMKSSK